ncbi:Transmembrane protein 253 [Merluccius polli]|uniref:Transmembrane protein 253 n=1 Tax=Merluccius polli TaxID=89951 RepID=A0AA47NYZ9_MERPO|nr:Transmembrane protein 253 [Merluccius polli]
MTQNMFQEGLYQVYRRETQNDLPPPVTTNQGDLRDARMQRWFGTVVGSRVLVTGATQVLAALACILSTVTYSCVSFKCSMAMTMPVWSSQFYVATGILALFTTKKPTKMRVATLMVLNLFSFLLGFSALLSFTVNSVHEQALSTTQQRIGSHVAKGSSITFTVLCLLASLYTLFLSWRGIRRYSTPNSQTYSPVAQHLENGTSPLLEQEELNL